MHRFGEVQAHRTSSNLLEPHHHRESKVWSVLLSMVPVNANESISEGEVNAILCLKAAFDLSVEEVRAAQTTLLSLPLQ